MCGALIFETLRPLDVNPSSKNTPTTSLSASRPNYLCVSPLSRAWLRLMQKTHAWPLSQNGCLIWEPRTFPTEGRKQRAHSVFVRREKLSFFGVFQRKESRGGGLPFFFFLQTVTRALISSQHGCYKKWSSEARPRKKS